jgi:hypothetical protein
VLKRQVLAEIATIVTPETLLRRHRKLIAEKYDGSAKRAPGRPRTVSGIVALAVRMRRRIGVGATDGSRRIIESGTHGGPRGHRQYLKSKGVELAPGRNRKTTWKEFLSRHWELIVAADFFTVEVWTRRGLQRFLELVFIELSTRRVKIGGIASEANGLWMSQIARDLSDPVDGLFVGKWYLIHDHDQLFTAEFLSMLGEVGVGLVKLPPRSPNPNAYVERFVRTIKETCLDRMILFGGSSLRKVIWEFVKHYHWERNH